MNDPVKPHRDNVIFIDRRPQVTPSDLRRQAEELIRQNQMPSLEDLLSAVTEVRGKYRPLILAARRTKEQ
jgi:hypothetical protein